MGGLFGAFPHLVALVEQLDLLELLEGLGEGLLGVVELSLQFVGRVLEVLAPLDGGLGVGRIGKMGGIVDPGAVLFDLDLPFKIGGHALEFGDHALDLHDLPALFVDLKLFQANERIA